MVMSWVIVVNILAGAPFVDVQPQRITTLKSCTRMSEEAVRDVTPQGTDNRGNIIVKRTVQCVPMNERDLSDMNSQFETLKTEAIANGAVDY